MLPTQSSAFFFVNISYVFFQKYILKVYLKIYMKSQRTLVLSQTMKTVKGFPFPQFLCFVCCLAGLEGEEIENSGTKQRQILTCNKTVT